MQSCQPGLQGWWLLPPALCLLLLQPIDLGLSHSSFHHLFRSAPPHLPLLRSWPPSWPAAAAGLWRDPASPRQSHPLEGRSVLPLPQNLQLCLGTGDDPVKKEKNNRLKQKNGTKYEHRQKKRWDFCCIHNMPTFLCHDTKLNEIWVVVFFLKSRIKLQLPTLLMLQLK